GVEANASRDAGVATAIGLRDGISAVKVEQLSPRAKFNFAMHGLRAALASERNSLDTSQRTLTLPSPGVPGEGSERAAKGDEADKQVLALAQKVKTVAAGLDSKASGDAKVAAVVAEIDRVSGASTAADLTR